MRLAAIGVVFSHPALCADQAALDHQLFQAIAKGDMGALRVLLDNGADIEARNEHGETPLFTAVDNHNPEMVKLLLEKGANVSAENNYKETVLIQAVRSMEPAMLQILLSANPDAGVKNDALFRAAEGGPVVIRAVDAPEESSGQNSPPASTLEPP
jgi:ankyrin repeat protein